MVRYRLYVGAGDVMAVARSVASHFPGATIFPTVGVWEGVVEVSVVVEIVRERVAHDAVDQLAEELRVAFAQSEVMVTREHLTAPFPSSAPGPVISRA